MQELKVIRQPTVANTKIVFEFDVRCDRFLASNLTEDDIFIGFHDNAQKEQMLVVPAGCSRVCVVNVRNNWLKENASDKVYIIPTATSEKGVEVQCLRW